MLEHATSSDHSVGLSSLLVAKKQVNCFIDWNLLLRRQCDKRTEVVDLTFDQPIHCPEDGVEVG